MKRLLQSLMLGAGLVTAGFFAQAAVTSVAAAPATVAETEDETLGTEANPYTVDAIVELGKDYKETGVWVEGYIVGLVDGTNWSDAIVGTDGTVNTNIILASALGGRGEFIPVQLPSGTVRNELNLVENPGNLDKKVKLYGNIEKYFGQPGFKGVTKYEFVEEAVNIDYSEFNGFFFNYETEDEVYAELQGEGNEYKAENVELAGGEYGFMLADNFMVQMFLGADGVMIDENNLSCTLEYINTEEVHGLPTINPIPVALEGTYNLTVVYDGDKANVTFEKVGGETPVLPTLDYANVAMLFVNEEGMWEDPVMFEGEGNEYKAENVACEGLKQLVLADFASQMQYMYVGDATIDENNLSATLNLIDMEQQEEMPTLAVVDLTGNYNIYVVYEADGAEAIVTFEKVADEPSSDISDYILRIEAGGYYTGLITPEGVLYKNVKFEGEDSFSIYDSWWTHYYGVDENDFDTIVTANNLTVTLVDGWVPCPVDLTGYYDVLAKFAEDEASVEVTFTRKGELTTTVSVAVEDGMAFSYNVENFSETSFNVATSDSFWNITGYTLNGVPTTFESPVGTYTHEFTAENACDFVFNVAFDGTVKILDGTTGMVEFDESAIQIKLVDGNVEIENLTAGEEVMVYSVSGQIIKSDVAHGTSMTVQLEKGAVYVVRAGKVAVKVAL